MATVNVAEIGAARARKIKVAGGWAIAAGEFERLAGRGKSELRRAVCRITSGTGASRLRDGKCHRENTAASQKDEVRVKRCGKSAPLRR